MDKLWKNKAIFVSLIATLLIYGCTTHSADRADERQKKPAPPGAENHVPGEILVKFVLGVSDAQVRAMVDSQGGRVLHAFSQNRTYQIELPPGQDVTSALKTYRLLPVVQSVEPNYRRALRNSDR